MLMQCIDSLVQKVQSGVVINFEKIGPDPLPVEGTSSGCREDGMIDESLMNVNLDADRSDSYLDNMCDDKNGVSKFDECFALF